MLNNRIFFFLILLLAAKLFSAQVVINDVIFEGNKFFSDRELQAQIRSRPGEEFDQKTANADASLLMNFYVGKGFYNLKVKAPKIATLADRKLNVIFQIEIADNPVIDKIEFNGNNYISASMIEAEVMSTTPELTELPDYIKKVVDIYARNGFLFAEVALDSLKHSADKLTAYLGISEGKYCEFTQFQARGNKVTKERTLIKLSRLQGVDKITPEVLELAAENIRRKDYIKDCRIFPVDHQTLFFEVEEDRMSYISGILGFNNDRDSDERFTGYINVDFLNLFGTDRSISFNWESLTADRTNLELFYHEAGFYNYPFSADIMLARTEYDSTYIKNLLQTDIYYYDLYNKYGVFFGQDDVFPGSRRPKLVEKNLFRRLGFFWERDKVDFYLNPTKGARYKLRYYYIFSDRENERITKQAVELGWDNYLALRKRLIFFTSVNGKIIENKSLEEIEYFKLGGNNDLRGFAEDEFSGYRISWSNFELRYLLGRSSRLFIFADHGYVENDDFRFWKLFGFGIGLRTQTRLGLLGIDYGFGYDGEELRNPLDGIIHFGLKTKL